MCEVRSDDFSLLDVTESDTEGMLMDSLIVYEPGLRFFVKLLTALFLVDFQLVRKMSEAQAGLAQEMTERM